MSSERSNADTGVVMSALRSLGRELARQSERFGEREYVRRFALTVGLVLVALLLRMVAHLEFEAGVFFGMAIVAAVSALRMDRSRALRERAREGEER